MPAHRQQMPASQTKSIADRDGREP